MPGLAGFEKGRPRPARKPGHRSYPAPKLRPVWPNTTTRPPVIYSQPWSPTPSTTAVAPLFRTAEPLSGHASEIRFATYRAVQGSVADNHVLARVKGRGCRRFDYHAATTQTLTYVIVSIAFEGQTDTVWAATPRNFARRDP